MRKYYTRACNFYYGNTAKNLILNKKALSLNSRKDIAFDQIEIFQRKKNHVVESKFYSVLEIKKLNRKILYEVEKNLRNVTLKRKDILDIDKEYIIGQKT